MRKVTTEYRCDRCDQQATFNGVRESLPSHWGVLEVRDGQFRYRTNVLCIPCRRCLDEFMEGTP